MEDSNRNRKWQNELEKLSDEELLDELQRPLDSWEEMVKREVLYRLLERSLK